MKRRGMRRKGGAGVGKWKKRWKDRRDWLARARRKWAEQEKVFFSSYFFLML